MVTLTLGELKIEILFASGTNIIQGNFLPRINTFEKRDNRVWDQSSELGSQFPCVVQSARMPKKFLLFCNLLITCWVIVNFPHEHFYLANLIEICNWKKCLTIDYIPNEIEAKAIDRMPRIKLKLLCRLINSWCLINRRLQPPIQYFQALDQIDDTYGDEGNREWKAEPRSQLALRAWDTELPLLRKSVEWKQFLHFNNFF